MHTRGSESCSKMSPQNCQKLEKLLGNIEIFLARNLIFLARNPIFLNGFPTFVNGFLLSSTAFQFSSMAFHFPRNPRKSIYGRKYLKDCYSSFVFPANCSPSFVIPATMSTFPPTLTIFISLLIFFLDTRCSTTPAAEKKRKQRLKITSEKNLSVIIRADFE
jgi:hypothetical protein